LTSYRHVCRFLFLLFLSEEDAPHYTKLFGAAIQMMEKLIAKVHEAGFDGAGALDCSIIILRPEAREACEKNRRGRYGKSWSCPPGCGSLDECAARIRRHANWLIVQTVRKLEDEFDGEGMMAAADRHVQSFRRFSQELRKDYPGMLPIGTGSCSNCDLCSYPDAPCRDPLGASSPMESYGMMVRDVCQANGMEYYHGKGTITFTGCFLLE
jgi:predicted metal-binding protein